MGSIRRIDGTDTDETITLSAMTRVGRASDNDVVLEDARVSQFHASITWTSPGVWELRDLGSSNGTFLDGVRVQPGDRRALAANARVSFGVDAPQWLVVETGRPWPEARDVATGKRHVGTTHMLSLPLGADTTVDIFEESRGSWVIEAAGVVRDVRHGEVIDVGGHRYKVSLPLPHPGDRRRPRASGRGRGREPSREHHAHVPGERRLRLRRAARRLERASLDHAEGVRARAALARRGSPARRARRNAQPARPGMGLRRRALHARGLRERQPPERRGAPRPNRFAREGVPGAPAIVERRRGTGQMRLGTSRVEIIHAEPRSGS